MASIKKIPAGGVSNWLRHNNRTVRKSINEDIDVSRTRLNYSLTPYINIPRDQQYDRREEIRKLEYEHYKELKEQFYCYNRKDVNTMVSIVVTLPKEIKDPETEERFFCGVAEFLTKRYSNTVSITVHKDEGKHFKNTESSMGQKINTISERSEGRPHLHYTFIPTVKINHAALAKKKNPVREMFNYSEKICAKERINRQDLLTLHPQMNKYLNEECGISCNINSGITREQGGNKSVAQLKKEFDQQIIKDLTRENEKLMNELSRIAEQTKEYVQLKVTVEEQQKRILELEQQQYGHEKEISKSSWRSSGSWKNREIIR